MYLLRLKRTDSNRTGRFLPATTIMITLIFLLLLFLASCGVDKGDEEALPGTGDVDGKVSVVTSMFPLYEFAKEVGGDNADVVLLLPPGLSPHSFEPTPKDIKTIEDADIFVFNGAGMEPWVEDILSGIDNRDLIVVDSSAGVNTLTVMEEHHHDDEAEEGHHHDEGEEDEGHHHAGGVDPHFWLDFDNAMVQVKNILDAYVEADPDNKAIYEERAKIYTDKLTALDERYREALSSCDGGDMISSGHFAFGYTARRYGFNHRSAFDLSHDKEPSPREISEMINIIREKKIEYIFAEELMDPKLARTLKEETGAEILVVNPAGNISQEALKSGTTFIDIMEDNLAKFKKGLKCR